MPPQIFTFRGAGFVPQANAFAYSVAADGPCFLVDTQLNTAERTLNVILSWEKAVSVKER